MKLTKILFFISLLAFVQYGCKDACDDVNCGPNGTCVDGTCNCDEGYSGDACQTKDCDGESHAGVYVGDILPCVPGTLSSIIPDAEREPLMATEILITANNADACMVTLGSTSEVIDIGLDANINGEQFTVPEFNQSVEVIGQTIEVTGGGTGMIVDENNFQLNMDIIYDLGLLGELNSSCEVTFTKQ